MVILLIQPINYPSRFILRRRSNTYWIGWSPRWFEFIILRRITADSGVVSAMLADAMVIHRLISPSPDDETSDRFFAKRLARLQSVQSFDQDEAMLISTNQNRCTLANFQHASRNLMHGLDIERLATAARHVNIFDQERLIVQHMLPVPLARDPCSRRLDDPVPDQDDRLINEPAPTSNAA